MCCLGRRNFSNKIVLDQTVPYLTGCNAHGEERVIALLAGGAAVTNPLLDQAIGLADGGVQVDDEGPVA